MVYKLKIMKFISKLFSNKFFFVFSFKNYYINLFLELYTLKYVCTVHNFDYIQFIIKKLGS